MPQEAFRDHDLTRAVEPATGQQPVPDLLEVPAIERHPKVCRLPRQPHRQVRRGGHRRHPGNGPHQRLVLHITQLRGRRCRPGALRLRFAPGRTGEHRQVDRVDAARRGLVRRQRLPQPDRQRHTRDPEHHSRQRQRGPSRTSKRQPEPKAQRPRQPTATEPPLDPQPASGSWRTARADRLSRRQTPRPQRRQQRGQCHQSRYAEQRRDIHPDRYADPAGAVVLESPGQQGSRENVAQDNATGAADHRRDRHHRQIDRHHLRRREPERLQHPDVLEPGNHSTTHDVRHDQDGDREPEPPEHHQERHERVRLGGDLRPQGQIRLGTDQRIGRKPSGDSLLAGCHLLVGGSLRESVEQLRRRRLQCTHLLRRDPGVSRLAHAVSEPDDRELPAAGRHGLVQLRRTAPGGLGRVPVEHDLAWLLHPPALPDVEPVDGSTWVRTADRRQ